MMPEKTRFQAVIVQDLVDVIEAEMGAVEGHRTDPVFLALRDRIEGQEVTLVTLGTDAFEEIDNNYWLPECCWSRVTT